MKNSMRVIFMILGVGLAVSKYGFDLWVIFLGVSAGYFVADVSNWFCKKFEKFLIYLDIFEN